ncbi:hypothetical protein QYE76_000316 [Lolium multiflorum]|uniref:CCHC-type domain-containing protein n=1 Tax=Lolium multiflorum TaxID=4521 RepID=A0AAD8RHB0_LOLMU|nr:hypothetical protein QYE76_000316 [Lolium multiflorum]
MRIVPTAGQLTYVHDAPLGVPPAQTAPDEVKNVYLTRKTHYSIVQCAILYGLESELQKRFENHDPSEIIRELKMIFETHAAVESYEASEHFFGCKMEEGSSVSEHVLKMSGHAKKLNDLGIVIPNQLGIHRVLQSLPPSYKNFVMNYNMCMNKELPELFSMLKTAEVEIKKEHQVLMVNKTTNFKKQGKPKNEGNFNKGGKKAAAPPKKPKASPKPDTVCFDCKEDGHWKRNCSKYLADLKSGNIKKKVHEFLLGLLFVYGIQLFQLTPNSLLHISIFVTLWECFLGVHPHWGLWKHIFYLRCNNFGSAIYNVGGVCICVRPDVGYFDLKFADSVQGCCKKWLYVKDEPTGGQLYGLSHVDMSQEILRRKSWEAEATPEEIAATESLVLRLKSLQNTPGQELSGVQILAHFLRIRVQPLQARATPFWMYSGTGDSARISADLPVGELEKLNHQIISQLPPLPEGGEVVERFIIDDESQDASARAAEPAGAEKSAGSSDKLTESAGASDSSFTHSVPSAASPKGHKRKRSDNEDSGESKFSEPIAEETATDFDPFGAAAKKALPLYQLLKKSDKFVWSPQADEAFRDLKRVLSTAPILASPASMEPMLLYIAATNWVVSVVLVVERKEADREQPDGISRMGAQPAEWKFSAGPSGAFQMQSVGSKTNGQENLPRSFFVQDLASFRG